MLARGRLVEVVPTRYLGHLHQTGRVPATDAMAVAAGMRRPRRRRGRAGQTAHLGRARGVPANGRARRRVRHRSPHLSPARAAPAAASSVWRPRSAAAGSTARSSPCCATAPSAAARWAPSAGPTWTCPRSATSSSPSAARRPTRPGGRADVRRLVSGCAAAVRSVHAAISPATREFGRRSQRRPDPPRGGPPTPPPAGRARRDEPRSARRSTAVTESSGLLSRRFCVPDRSSRSPIMSRRARLSSGHSGPSEATGLPAVARKVTGPDRGRREPRLHRLPRTSSTPRRNATCGGARPSG